MKKLLTWHSTLAGAFLLSSCTENYDKKLSPENSDKVCSYSCYKIAIKNRKHRFQAIWWDRFETGPVPGVCLMLPSWRTPPSLSGGSEGDKVKPGGLSFRSSFWMVSLVHQGQYYQFKTTLNQDNKSCGYLRVLSLTVFFHSSKIPAVGLVSCGTAVTVGSRRLKYDSQLKRHRSFAFSEPHVKIYFMDRLVSLVSCTTAVYFYLALDVKISAFLHNEANLNIENGLDLENV